MECVVDMALYNLLPLVKHRSPSFGVGPVDMIVATLDAVKGCVLTEVVAVLIVVPLVVPVLNE